MARVVYLIPQCFGTAGYITEMHWPVKTYSTDSTGLLSGDPAYTKKSIQGQLSAVADGPMGSIASHTLCS